MHWKTSKGTFLLEKNRAPIPFISGGVGLANGERFDEAAEYEEVTPAGDILRTYGAPLPFSIEDEMTVSRIHLVIGTSLYKFYWSQQYRYEPRLEVELLLTDLQLCEGPFLGTIGSLARKPDPYYPR